MSHRTNEFGQPIGAPVPGWTARARPQRKAMSGYYTRLEPVDVERHARDLFRAYMETPDSRDWTYLFHERPEQMDAFRTYLDGLAKSEDPLHYAIIDLESRNAVGTAALMRIEPVHGVIEVGSIAFSPQMKG